MPPSPELPVCFGHLPDESAAARPPAPGPWSGQTGRTVGVASTSVGAGLALGTLYTRHLSGPILDPLLLTHWDQGLGILKEQALGGSRCTLKSASMVPWCLKLPIFSPTCFSSSVLLNSSSPRAARPPSQKPGSPPASGQAQSPLNRVWPFSLPRLPLFRPSLWSHSRTSGLALHLPILEILI